MFVATKETLLGQTRTKNFAGSEVPRRGQGDPERVAGGLRFRPRLPFDPEMFDFGLR